MNYEAARERMVDRLVSEGRIQRDATAEALRAVPRHEFVPPDRRESAYADRPLPIGANQTVSAPHMVAVMCDLLAPDPDDDVLEIGTGCGYHAAVTAELLDGGSVASVEYKESLAADARETLARLGYDDDVDVRVGDGHEGWPERAPYGGAYLTCAAASVPDSVLEQVREGGVVVAPVGRGRQTLVTLAVTPGGVEREEHGGVRFVPMVGG